MATSGGLRWDRADPLWTDLPALRSIQLTTRTSAVRPAGNTTIPIGVRCRPRLGADAAAPADPAGHRRGRAPAHGGDPTGDQRLTGTARDLAALSYSSQG